MIMSLHAKKTILMAVFNPVEFDGRVQRSIHALNSQFQIFLLCPVSYQNASSSLTNNVTVFRSLAIWKKLPTTVALWIFWFEFVFFSILIRPNVIYVHDRYLALPGIVSSWLIRAKSIYDAHELSIPNSFDTKNKSDWVYYLCEKLSIKYFSLVIVANQSRALIMKKFYKLVNKPLVIENITNPNQPYEKLSLKNKIKKIIQTNFTVVYVGDVDNRRGINKICQLMSHLPKSLYFLVVGSGPSQKSLKKEYQKNKNIIFIDQIKQSCVSSILKLCDVGVICYNERGLNNIYCAPNKIHEYTQAGLPVIVTSQPSLVHLVKKYKIGEFISLKKITPILFSKMIFKINKNKKLYQKNIKEFILNYNFNNEQIKLQKAVRFIC